MNAITLRTASIAVGTLVTLAGVNVTIHEREALLTHGRVVFLPLAPVDPRSLMQGDYMALRFALARQITGIDLERAGQGNAILQVGSDRVARYVGLDYGRQLKHDELRLTYRVRDKQVKVVTNAWFFQEGDGARFQGARFGVLRVAPDGTALLEGLADEQRNLIPAVPPPSPARG
jgi:uncharacterized membrane-anchored protein